MAHYNDSASTRELSAVINFGTNSTQVGYVNKETKQTHIIQDWPNGVDTSRTKTDILLSWKGKFVDFGYRASREGMSTSHIDSNADHQDNSRQNMLFKSFKRALYNYDTNDLYSKIQCEDGRLCATSSLITEAFKFMKRKVMKDIKFELKMKDTDIDIQWRLAIPAVWSDIAKHKLETYAANGGLMDLNFVYETECASVLLYLQNDIDIHQSGHKYMLIDTGAGITDIACYEVVTSDKLVNELCIPKSIPLGSNDLDYQFERLLVEIFGSDVMNQFKQSHSHSVSDFYRSKMQFYTKPGAASFSVRLTQTFMNSMDGVARIVRDAKPYGLTGQLSMDNGRLNISSLICTKYLFDRVMNPILDEIKTMISLLCADHNTVFPRYLAVCGGLSESRYFMHRIHQLFGEHSQYRLTIKLATKEKALRTLKGGLQLVLNPNFIATRHARCTYGIAVDRSIKNVDINTLPPGYLEKNTYTHPHTHRRTVRNLFSVWIRKNQSVVPNVAISKQYRRFHHKERMSKLSIYCSVEEDPYVVKEDQKPLLAATIQFPQQFHELAFSPQFYLGDTKIRADIDENLMIALEYTMTDSNNLNDYYAQVVPPTSEESKVIEVEEKEPVAAIGAYGMVMDTPGNDAGIAKKSKSKELDNNDQGFVVDTIGGNDLKQKRVQPGGVKDDDIKQDAGNACSADDKCQLEFERFLTSMPKQIGQHLNKFKQNGYNDIRYVTVLDLETLKDEIGMKGPHAKIFMKRIDKYQTDYKKFELLLDELNMKEKYHIALENAGIATFESYYHYIKSMDDLKLLINDQNDVINMWQRLRTKYNTNAQVEGK
eukprot:881805_1